MAIRNIIQKVEQEYPPVVGGITGVDLSNYVQSGDIYNAAVEWTANHTLVDGTRYLAGDLVYVSGKIYKANFDNESIPVTSALYWTDLGNGYRLNIDGRDIPNIPISQNVVFTTGDQTIGGLKDLTTRPTVNTVPVLLSGEVNTTISGVFFTAEVNIKNDNGSTIFKGQPVYVSSAAGSNILVKLASNTGEATSSKTFGLVNQSSLDQNAQGTVVTEGLLQGFNTSAAGNEGDPIWLGPTGNLIFGLTNKPQAPNHLVYLGVVTRKHATQGEIFVHIQNGFEVRELHDARIINEQNRDVLIYNSGSGLWLNSQLNINDIVGSNNIFYTTGDQTISGNKTFEADEYIFSGSSITITGNSILSVDQQTQTKGIVKDMGGVSGIQVMTTGAYNAITPLSGVVYILI